MVYVRAPAAAALVCPNPFSITRPEICSRLVRSAPSCTLLAAAVSCEAMSHTQGGGPGKGQGTARGGVPQKSSSALTMELSEDAMI